MNICLVRPPAFVSNERVHPYNLECLSQSLSQEGHEVSWVDAELMADGELDTVDGGSRLQKFVQDFFIKQKMASRIEKIDHLFDDLQDTFFKRVTDAILATNPDIIGLSCYSSSMAATKKILQVLEISCDPDLPVIIGGIHPTSVPRETMNNINQVKYIALGEGESVLSNFVDCIDRKDFTGLSKVRGLVYRNERNEICFGKQPKPQADLSSLPILDWKHASPQYNYYATMTSRGCPFNCSFCASKKMWGRRVRFRRAAHVVQEIINLRKMTKSNNVTLADDTFTLSKAHMRRVSEELRNRSVNDVWLSIGSRIDTIDQDKVAIAKEMGVREMAFGVESGSQRILDTIGKRIDINDVIPKIRMVNKAGIYTNTFFIINHPEETRADMRATLQLINALNRQCKLNTVMLNIGFPYPGTPWWNYCLGKGLTSLINFYEHSYKYNHQLDPVANMTAEPSETLLSFVRSIDKVELNQLMKVRWRKASKMLFSSPRFLFERILTR